MKKQGYRQHIISAYLIAIAVAAGIACLAALLQRAPDTATVFDEAWQLQRNGEDLGSYAVPFYRTGHGPEDFPQGTYTVVKEFSPEQRYAHPVLVLPYTNANALQVTLNGVLLGTFGDMQQGRTARWNVPHLFSVPPELLRERNRLELRLYGLYEIGLSSPPYLAERSAAAGHYLLLFLMNNLLIAFALGSILLLALLFILTSGAIETGQRERILIALALLSLALYLTDYLQIELLPLPYHIFKRSALVGLYLSICFSVPGFYGYTHRRLDTAAYIAMMIPAAAALTIAIVPTNIFDVRNIYAYANFSFLPFIITLHIALFPRLKRDRRAFWILMGLTVLCLLALRDVLVVLLATGRPILTHFGIVLLEAALAFALIGEMLEYYSRMVNLKQWADTVYQESMRDPLTGALNRKILHSLKRLSPDSFSLILLDLDDFKEVNDRYGHATGDRVLKVLVETIVLHIRKTDYVVRLGGDEFAVILFSCDLPTAEKNAEMLHARISARTVSSPAGEIRIACSMGVGEVVSARSLEERMEEIDHLLYYAKRSGKGKVVSDRTNELANRVFSE